MKNIHDKKVIPLFWMALLLVVLLWNNQCPVWAAGNQADTAVPAEEKKPDGVTDEEWEKIKAKRPLPFDSGPAVINVSKYPQEMKDIYTNIFSIRCSKCHTISRPINAPYALPEEWNRYIKKMMKKPGSGIPPDAAKQIAKFLIFDSEQRKPDQVAKKLKEKDAAAPVKK